MPAQKLLEGKVAIVTGAARRIGRATALALAEQGASVMVHAKNSGDEVAAVAKEIQAAGGKASWHLADVTDEAEVKGLVDKTVQEFGRLDILVSNAANRAMTPLLEMSYQEWREIIDIVLDGAFHTSRAAIPHMIKAGGGAIVTIGGLTGHAGAHNRAHVITAKAGLVGFTKALAVEFGAQGIRANCVVPGKIGGERSKTAGEAPPSAGNSKPLLSREGEVGDVAAMVMALCLPTAQYMTGQTIHVNGGLYLP